MLVLADHTISIYLPNSPVLLFMMAFIGAYLVFRVVTYLIKLLPFL